MMVNKFIKRKIFVAAVLLFVIGVPGAAHAVSLGIGATCWYVKWDPYWDRNSHYTNSYGGLYRSSFFGPSDYHEKSSINPALLYGPTISLSLPKHFKVMSSFIYGEFNGSGSGQGLIMGGAYMINRKYLAIKRYDSDSMISYSIFKFFNVFVGFKYMYYEYKVSDDLPYYNGMIFLIVDRIRKGYREYAPGAGIGFTIPLIKDTFYLLVNGSAIYNFSSYKTSERTLLLGGSTWLPFVPFRMKKSLSKLGCNASAAFAYYIQPIRTSISAGFRYQMFKLLQNDSSESISRQKYLWEHFYGLTVGVMVNINLTPSAGKEQDQAE